MTAMSAPRCLYAVRNIKASRVNLLMNDFAAGLPSPLAFLGLADFLGRRLGLAPWSARVLPVMHQVYVPEGRTRPEMVNKAGVFTQIEIMEDMTGIVDLSLLIEIPGCDSETALRDAMDGSRIAGGVIQNDTLDVAQVTADGSALRGLRRGYAMARPDTRERLRISTGDAEGLQEIAATLFPAQRPQGSGWIVPTSVGYRLLEDPDTAPKRLNTRSNTVPHVFVEPIVGIAELISARSPRLVNLTEKALAALMWSWDARGDLVLGHADYRPDSLHAS